MMIAEKMSVFVVIIICLLSSPIEKTENVYIDGIDCEEAGDIEPIYCMLQKNGKTIKCYEYKNNKDLEYIFTIERINENDYIYMVKTEEGESSRVDLSEYFSREDINRIENKDKIYLELDTKKEDGEVNIIKIGEVAYIKIDAFPDMLFSVHE